MCIANIERVSTIQPLIAYKVLLDININKESVSHIVTPFQFTRIPDSVLSGETEFKANTVHFYGNVKPGGFILDGYIHTYKSIIALVDDYYDYYLPHIKRRNNDYLYRTFYYKVLIYKCEIPKDVECWVGEFDHVPGNMCYASTAIKFLNQVTIEELEQEIK